MKTLQVNEKIDPKRTRKIYTFQCCRKKICFETLAKIPCKTQIFFIEKRIFNRKTQIFFPNKTNFYPQDATIFSPAKFLIFTRKTQKIFFSFEKLKISSSAIQTFTRIAQIFFICKNFARKTQNFHPQFSKFLHPQFSNFFTRKKINARREHVSEV